MSVSLGVEDLILHTKFNSRPSNLTLDVDQVDTWRIDTSNLSHTVIKRLTMGSISNAQKAIPEPHSLKL